MPDNGMSATDIITYIGVPLAVLGVLPILYNTFATLASLSRIQRMLRKSRLTALTRSDVVNRVIEIELPRYAVKPWDRYQDSSEYWSLSQHPSSIPGGSWTTFNWKTNTIGIKTQRVEYADQVRQPQVDIAFDELVSYLLDLGAVPDPHGWKLLRSTGLWTPIGCALMLSPDGREKALTVAPQDDADGNLSLAVTWLNSWTTRDHEHLPPYWVRLPAPRKLVAKSTSVAEEDNRDETKQDIEALNEAQESNGAEFIGEEQEEANPNTECDITCQIIASGISSAFSEGDLFEDTDSSTFNIDHLRIQPGLFQGIWFASAATAYGTTSQTVLWNYKIPDEILIFSRKETVPCGIMVLLGMADDSDTPDWATKDDDYGASHERFMRRTHQSHEAWIAESKMSPADRAVAFSERARKENEQRMQDMREDMRLQRQRAEKRMLEALQSPKWTTKLVAQHCLRWLQSNKTWEQDLGTKDVVGHILHRMVHDKAFALEICRMLDLWKSWADIGGMRRSDYDTVKDDKSAFAHAALLLSMIMDTSNALEGTLSMDLQECLRLWHKVRLG
ncbi:hypothetical protein HJFPF1_08165 [Paramyrothecium foliicola]|nr:hypothetical protein HJFPF1_08165 [Paramyrothecium foliicola]